jgi:hypothetical protein
MKRQFRILGMALMAVLAMSAFAATTASAVEFHAETAPTTITGNQQTAHVFTIENGLTTTCPVAEFHGSVSTKTATEITATAVYKGETTSGGTVHPCRAFLGLAATINMNGCAYVFHATAGSGDNYTGTADVECPAGKVITITAGTCEVTVGDETTGGKVINQNLGTVNFVNNTAAGDVSVNPDITSSITYDKVKDGFGCPLSGTGEKSDGSYTGTTTVVGENPENGAPHDIWVE